MCGIVGCLSRRAAAPFLLDALRRLEYRGYDSAGIATSENAGLRCIRAVGKISNLGAAVAVSPPQGKVGIGHTRWATHGAPTERNAHPHYHDGVAVVHNGIIENHRKIKQWLSRQGYRFSTETDTEAIAKLCAFHLRQGATPREAASHTIAELEGAFALCFLFDAEKDLLIAARSGSPLVVGHGESEMFIASDVNALATVTNRISFLEEGDRVELSREDVVYFDSSGQQVQRRKNRLFVDPTLSDKDGFKHYLAKEIAQQPSVLSDAIGQFLPRESTQIELPKDLDFSCIERVCLIACGTAYLACEVGKYMFEQLAELPTEVDIASEFRYRRPVLSDRTLVICVSQSGETADTLAALRLAKKDAHLCVGLVNNLNSSIARECDLVIPTNAGIEVSVASTKAFTCQLIILAILAIAAGRDRNRLGNAEYQTLCPELRSVPGLVNQAFSCENRIREIAASLTKSSDVLFLGRGTMYPLAMEGALKLKEISYIHAEGFAGGELKHGPIALVEPDLPAFMLAPSGDLFEKSISNMEEIMARGARVYLVTDRSGAAMAEHEDELTIKMPKGNPLFDPLVYAIPVQLIAYHTAVAKGTDVDQPRNLAKSVTVE